MKRIVIMGLVLVATVVQLRADGKMFWREKIPPNIPYQRALIHFRDGTETLVLQSRYEISEANEQMTLGWVVPMPAVPEVASMPADEARRLFWNLSGISQPVVTRVSDIIVILIPITVASGSVLTLLLCLLSFFKPFPPGFMKRREQLVQYSLWGLGGCVFIFFIMSCFLTAGSQSGGVDVIAEHRVGIYDVRVVRSDNADELISWLGANEFKFTDKDTSAFDSYISRGWCFVVAVINPTKDQHQSDISSEGLAAPLILRFPHANPVYPLALTGTGGFDTEILIYLAADTKMSCEDRLKLRFANLVYGDWLRPLSSEVEPKGFFELKTDEDLWLCKFRDRLSPGEMSTDIIFTPAKDQEPYREHIVKW
jgi:hypothetical protein